MYLLFFCGTNNFLLASCVCFDLPEVKATQIQPVFLIREKKMSWQTIFQCCGRF